MDHAKNPHRELFDKFGNYRKRQAVVVEEHFVDAVLDEGSIVDRCVGMLTKQISMNVKQNWMHGKSNLESVIGKPSDVSLVGHLLIWLRKPS